MPMKAPLLMCLLASIACGSSSGEGGTMQSHAVKVSVVGRVAALPVPPIAATRDFTGFTVHVMNPATLMLNPTRVAPLGSAALDEAECTDVSCAFDVPDVNIS